MGREIYSRPPRPLGIHHLLPLVKRKSFPKLHRLIQFPFQVPNRTLDHNIDAILTELAHWGEEMVELGAKEE